jgi:hypothetical protein
MPQPDEMAERWNHIREPADKPIVVRGWMILDLDGRFGRGDYFFRRNLNLPRFRRIFGDRIRRATLTIEPKARKRK